MKGTDVPGLTFDAIFLLTYKWNNKYPKKSWSVAYEKITLELGYSKSSIDRYRDFFTDSLASINWLENIYISDETTELFNNIKTKPFLGSFKLKVKSALPLRGISGRIKKHQEIDYYLDYPSFLKIRMAISRNPCINGCLKKIGHPKNIKKNDIENYLIESKVFKKEKSTASRRASDVYNWIKWLKDTRVT